MPTTQSPTAVSSCEACWTAPVDSVRTTSAGIDLLCRPCAVAGYPRRVDLFPPLGIYGLTTRRIDMKGKHRSGDPKPPPDQGPPLPKKPPPKSPPGTPPV
ncbi:hypothetical protein OG596_26205 [Streptomyces sp. NBC_01102]|uniref:hypothetical protein n=1 Tax=Streptomyces sp. NBC_01102 TaxID=2903749 RepID=UPI00386AED45|nr:hypothetical protein OG596_26205 [Streptomyces sp. NBC_01102]